MRLQRQRFEHKPELGTWGDCFRTAVASLMGVDLDEVPHHHHPIDAGEQTRLMREWLKPQGLTLAFFAFTRQGDHDGLHWAKQVMATCNPGVVYILSGSSPRGLNHSVLARDGEIIWDPHPCDEGLVGPCDDDHAYVELLVRCAD